MAHKVSDTETFRNAKANMYANLARIAYDFAVTKAKEGDFMEADKTLDWACQWMCHSSANAIKWKMP